ncbi:hypothetical protein CPLU01_12579 [Colletotrichum plurivorum]|uniref:Uncharacterized protein n=1 Tax=Colletotrichum plurivorum TaxID=2175906 RepID=A0A8H6JXY3_9PEZI|nr:hypothetical protein CPLU01_12579 [Colletotrichum plurivorum]
MAPQAVEEHRKMSPSLNLNPTAPAFSLPPSSPLLASPSISTSKAASRAADPVFDLDCPDFDLDLILALDADLSSPASQVSDAGKIAFALLGESLVRAVFQPTSSSSADGPEDDEFDVEFPSSPPVATVSLASTSAIWDSVEEPVSLPCSPSEMAYSVTSYDDEGIEYEPVTPPHRASEPWAWEDDWEHDEAVLVNQERYSEPCTTALPSCAPVLSPTFGGLHLATVHALQQQLAASQYYASMLGISTGAVHLQPQFVVSPPFHSPVNIAVQPAPAQPRMAPLWPLLSALHRNLARSRPDLYGPSPPLAYLQAGSSGPVNAVYG